MYYSQIYQIQQLINAIVPIMLVAMGVGMARRMSSQKMPIRRGYLSTSKETTLYHGTLLRNVDRMLKEGIRPFKNGDWLDKLITRVCKEYNFPKEKLSESTLEMLKERIEETQGRVFLTTCKDYAISQSVSSLEPEALIKETILNESGIAVPYDWVSFFYPDVKIAILTINMPTANYVSPYVVAANYVSPKWIVKWEQLPISAEKIWDLIEEYRAFEALK